MRGDRVWRSHSPQKRYSILTNRTVFAVWLLVLAGVLTATEPLLALHDQLGGVWLGLYAPSLAGDAASFAGAGLLIALGVATGYRMMPAAAAGAVLLAADFIFLAINGGASADLMPLIASFIVRYIFVRFIGRGAYAIVLRDRLGEQMREADKEYETERRKRPAKPNTEEDEYQG